MRLVDFVPLNEANAYPRFGVVVGAQVIEIGDSALMTVLSVIQHAQSAALLDDLRVMVEAFTAGHAPRLHDTERRVFALRDVRLCAPIRRAPSFRDFMAFEQHIKTITNAQGREVAPAWYQVPVFYFSNPAAFHGPDETVSSPHSVALDYELEVACVIGKEGRNIPPEQAEDYIFGYTILNDWSARDLQMVEMSVLLGPAKGKDFATSLGPYLVTPDELADRHAGRPGVFDLSMLARVNGEEKSRGNWSSIHWSFGDMIARASQDVTLYPGDIIGSGTVGSGCLAEATLLQGPWLQPGDVVELEVERLGVLRSTIGEIRN